MIHLKLFLYLFIIYILSFLLLFVYLYCGKPCTAKNEPHDYSETCLVTFIHTLILTGLLVIFYWTFQIEEKISRLRMIIAWSWVIISTFGYILWSKKVVSSTACPLNSNQSALQAFIIVTLSMVGILMSVFINNKTLYLPSLLDEQRKTAVLNTVNEIPLTPTLTTQPSTPTSTPQPSTSSITNQTPSISDLTTESTSLPTDFTPKISPIYNDTSYNTPMDNNYSETSSISNEV